MDTIKLTASLDVQIADSRGLTVRLQAERAELLTHVTDQIEPWEVDLGLVSDWDAGPGHRGVLGVAQRLLAGGLVQARIREDQLNAPETIFLDVIVQASDERTAVALAKELILQAGGDPDYYDPELGSDWSFSWVFAAADAGRHAVYHDGSTLIENASALAVIASWLAQAAKQER